jgi:hypothetical protein
MAFIACPKEYLLAIQVVAHGGLPLLVCQLRLIDALHFLGHRTSADYEAQYETG